MRQWPAALRGGNIIVAIAAVVVAIGFGQLYAGPGSVGITTDEPVHAGRMASWLQYGWYVSPDGLEDGEPRPGDDLAKPYVYGPAYSLLAHEANVALGNEPGDEIATTADAYRVRHLVVALLAALAALAVGLAVLTVTRSPRFGLWAAAGLLSVPAWTGHGFFNLKDVPAGAGYTLVTVGLLVALDTGPDSRDLRLRRLGVGALLAGGLFVGVGTRLSLWVPILASLVVYAALRSAQRALGKSPRDWGADLAVAGGAAAGIAAAAAIYPKVFSDPFTLMVETVSSAAEFSNSGVPPFLTAGQLLDTSPPLWYLPAWVAASLPVLIGCLGVAGLAVAAVALVRSWQARSGGRFWSRPELGLLLPLQQATLLPLAAIVGGGTMYDGIRQHLYVLPAAAILAGFGAAALWRWAGRPGVWRWSRPLATAVLALALVVPTTEQLILFPYNYAYVNPVAGIGGIEGRWEADYWQASAPEAISHVPRGVELRCSFDLIPAGAPTDTSIDFVPCYEENFAPFADRLGTDVRPGLRPKPATVWAIGRHRAGNQPPDGCEHVGDVTRWLRGESVVMSYVLRCPIDPGG